MVREISSAVVTLLSLVVAVMLEQAATGHPSALVSQQWLVWIDVLFCGFFWIEFFAGLKSAPDKKQYVRANVFPLLGALPLIVSLRWLRLIRVFRIFRVLRLGVISYRLWRNWLRLLTTNPLSTLGLAAFLVTVIGSAGFAYFEMGVNDKIQTYMDAVWLTVASATTVGFGDLYPVTLEGKIIALFVFCIGIGLFGSLTATIATHLVHEPESNQVTLDDIDKRLERIEKQIATLRQKQ